jgi:hypothetical protein
MRHRVSQLFKNGGFTACAARFTVMPRELECQTGNGEDARFIPLEPALQHQV